MCAPPFATKQRPPIWKILDPPLADVHHPLSSSSLVDGSEKDSVDQRIFKCVKNHKVVKYACSYYHKSYYSEAARKSHMKIVHLGINRARCSMSTCNFSCNDYDVLKVHIYEDHGIGEAPVCDHPKCKDRTFTNWRTFERHRMNFHRIKDRECPHCLKWYKYVSGLENHLNNAHSDKQKHQCDECKNFFVSHDSIQSHKKSQH